GAVGPCGAVPQPPTQPRIALDRRVVRDVDRGRADDAHGKRLSWNDRVDAERPSVAPVRTVELSLAHPAELCAVCGVPLVVEHVERAAPPPSLEIEADLVDGVAGRGAVAIDGRERPRGS